MHILVLSINYWPDETGIAAFNIRRCEYLASRGHRVTICAGPPYYPQWRVPEGYRKLIQREVHNGVTILRSWMFVPHSLNTRKRMLHEASFLASCFLRALASQKPDLIFAVSPPLGIGLVASTLGRLWNVPYIFDVEDLQPDAAVELGMMTRGRLTDFLYNVEWRSYKNAALISTLTEGMRQRIVEKGIDPSKVVLFPVRSDPTLYTLRRCTDRTAFREKYGLQGKLIVSHSGNMGVKQGLGVILDAAERSRERDDIRYLFVGDGAVRAKLQAEASSRNLDNVLFLPLLTNEEFTQMLSATHIALITQQRVVSDIVFPSKTVSLLSAGCPVIASVNSGSEVAKAILRSGAGRVVEPENGEALWNAIRELAGCQQTLAHMSKQAREFAIASWDEQRTLPQMEAHFTECARRWSSR